MQKHVDVRDEAAQAERQRYKAIIRRVVNEVAGICRLRHQVPDMWEWCLPFFRKRLMDGTWSKPPALLMRRRTASGWEYRLPTPEEESDYVDSDAW